MEIAEVTEKDAEEVMGLTRRSTPESVMADSAINEQMISDTEPSSATYLAG